MGQAYNIEQAAQLVAVIIPRISFRPYGGKGIIALFPHPYGMRLYAGKP
jgi:hypothetical protein